MKYARLLATLGIVVMSAALIYALTAGDFGSDGPQILRNPWGIVSIVDLFTGFALFSAWIAFREKSVVRAFFWVVMMMVMGNLTASLYTFIALYTSGGEWKKFWMGRRADA